MEIFYVGIDIQMRRGCSYAIINKVGALVTSGWSTTPELEIVDIVKKYKSTAQTIVGIDAPRMPLKHERDWYWSGRNRRWRSRRNEGDNGRHCEVVLKAHNIANPQWTPLEGNAPEWMEIGFKLFEALSRAEISAVHEVFPTASYALLSGVQDVRLDIDFSQCKPGPKDMVDAWISAATVREFVKGKGSKVGGGDGMGTIILPRPLPPPVIKEVLRWPTEIKSCNND